MTLTICFRYGGTYLDLDVISLKPQSVITAQNFICAQENDWSLWDPINGAIMRLVNENGREIAEKIMKLVNPSYCFANVIALSTFSEFVKNYNPDVYAWNGPYLITNFLRPLCATKKIITEPIVCSNLTIFPSQKCYEVENWKHFFKEKYSKQTIKRLDQSYFSHLWNHCSKDCKLSTKSSAALILLAKDYCPEVLQGEIF